MAEGGSDQVEPAANTRGARIARWTFTGDRGAHVVEVFSRGLGSPRLETWVDGQFVVAADMPSHPDPWTIMEAGEIDGYEVCAGVESREGGTGSCDLFVDGISLTTAEPISAIVERSALAEVDIAKSWIRRDDVRLRAAGCYFSILVAIVALIALAFIWILFLLLTQKDCTC